MNSRFFALMMTCAAVVSLFVLAPSIAAGQGGRPLQTVCPSQGMPFYRCALEKIKTFTSPPRTADGHPDFNGAWRTGAGFAHESLEEHVKTADDTGGMAVVVDPADGRLPLQPWARAQQRENFAKYIDQNANCFMSGIPRHMYMAPAYNFIQTPNYIAIPSEEAHATRIIIMDGRPHIGKDILLWQGDQRGHWEGNTLVVETTNQNGRAFLDQRGTFYTNAAKVTERMTYIAQDVIAYVATIDDPLVYTRPYTIAFPMAKNANQGFEIWEESCYEGESTVAHLIGLGFRNYPGVLGPEAIEKAISPPDICKIPDLANRIKQLDLPASVQKRVEAACHLDAKR